MTEDTGGRMLPIEKGKDIPHDQFRKIWNFIVEEGRYYLQGSNLVTGGKPQSRDIGMVKSFYGSVNKRQEEVLGIDGAVFNRPLREHLLLAERVALGLADVLGLDKDLVDVESLLHDFGRMVSHRRGVNDDFAKDLARDIGIKDSLMNMLPPDSMWEDNNPESVRKNIEKMCNENGGMAAAILLADVIGKWKDRDKGELRKWEDVVPLTNQRQNKPKEEEMWPIEFNRQTIITSDAGKEYVRIKYEVIKDWFEEKSGVKINDFIATVETSLRKHPIKNSWV